MRNVLKVVLFSLFIIGFYTYYANSIPQIKSMPPEEITIGAGMSAEELIEAGKKIFYGKGGCAVCHAIGQKGQRAPDLQAIGINAASRKPGKSSTQYLVESLIEPGAYVVKGYANIMPPVHKPPVSLKRTEILAVVSFLQSLGARPTVKLEDIPELGSVVAEAPEKPIITGDPENGKNVFKTNQCILCHKTKDFKLGSIGPDLSSIGAINTERYIQESILNPNAKVVTGFPPNTMPQYFAQKLSVKDFYDLVAYLKTQK